ncbi:MAG: NrfD/PsrC family molybdoenzyme membrane anchor subunit [Thermodesulfobacteriota bacterium]
MIGASTLSGASPQEQGQHARSGLTTFLWVLWAALLVAGLVGVWQRLMYGHNPAGYGSYVPWGLWIGLYFMGVAIAGGAFVFGAIGYILGWPCFRRPEALRIAIVLSLAAILPAFTAVWLDLGRMDRLYLVLTSSTFTSMMAFNAWMYNVFVVVAVLCWLLSFARGSVWLKPLLCVGAFLSILFPSQSGVFFEAVATKDYWNSPLLSILFLSSAAAAGAGTLLLVKVLLGPLGAKDENAIEEHGRGIRILRLITIAGLIAYLAFEFAEISIEVWSPGRASVPVQFLVSGGYWWIFWILQLAIGAGVPLLLYVFTENRKAWAASAMFLILGFVAARMGILVPGQIEEQIHGLQQAFQDIRLVYSYHPTVMEYLVGAFLVAVGMAVFYVGLRLTNALGSRSGQEA